MVFAYGLGGHDEIREGENGQEVDRGIGEREPKNGTSESERADVTLLEKISKQWVGRKQFDVSFPRLL